MKTESDSKETPSESTFIEKPCQAIGCDQVVWVSDILGRFEEVVKFKRQGISRISQAAKLSALIELMEILHLKFDSEEAYQNAVNIILPREKQPEYEVEK